MEYLVLLFISNENPNIWNVDSPIIIFLVILARNVFFNMTF